GTDSTRLAYRYLMARTETAADVREITTRQRAQAESLLARATIEARSGARIVFWGEGNARVFKEGEQELIACGRTLARQHHIFLRRALSTWDRARTPPRENKFVLIDPTGEVDWQYLKTHPAPGAESRTIAGDGRLRVENSPYGRITSAICYDADFPG